MADLQRESPLCRAGRTRRHHAPGSGTGRLSSSRQGLKKYIDATRIVAGASVPTIGCLHRRAAFNLLATEDIDVQSRANAPHPSSLYYVVGSESGWRKSSAFRETMQGHVEADERVHTLHGEAEGSAEDGSEFRAKGFSPRALRGPLDDGWGEVSYWPSDRITEGDWTPAIWRSPTPG